MIKASDFRLGNWVKTNDGCECIVSSIKDSHIEGDIIQSNGEKGVRNTIPISELEGICLTNSILSECKFNCNEMKAIELNVYTFDLEKKNIRINIFEQDEEFRLFISTPSFERKYNKEVALISISFVHQLQNIFFATTGEELKINI